MLELLERHAAYHPLGNLHPDDKAFFEHRHQEMDREVKEELRRLKILTPSSVDSHGIITLKHQVRHNLEDMLVSHFLQKYPGFAVILESARGTFYGESPDQIVMTPQDPDEVAARLRLSRPIVLKAPKAEATERFIVQDLSA